MTFKILDTKEVCDTQIQEHKLYLKYTKKTILVNKHKKAIKYWELLRDGHWREAGSLYNFDV